MKAMPTLLGKSYRPDNIPNLDIQWESQEQWNLGLDLGLLNNRVNLTLDWYRKESKDMLMPLQLPSYMGTSGNVSSVLAPPYGNYGTIRNTGLELTVNTHPLVGRFQSIMQEPSIRMTISVCKESTTFTTLLGMTSKEDLLRWVR